MLISVQLPQPPALLTEHQIKKVSQLYICGLRGETSLHYKRLQRPSSPLPTIPCAVVHHRAAPLMNPALLKSNLHCSDSLLQPFASIHPPPFATPTRFGSIGRRRKRTATSPATVSSLPICIVIVSRPRLTHAGVGCNSGALQIVLTVNKHALPAAVLSPGVSLFFKTG